MRVRWDGVTGLEFAEDDESPRGLVLMQNHQLDAVIRPLEEDDNVISAHRPEFFHDLHAHFLRLSYRSFAALNCVFNVANTLVCKLNQPDISSHKCSFPVVASNRLV